MHEATWLFNYYTTLSADSFHLYDVTLSSCASLTNGAFRLLRRQSARMLSSTAARTTVLVVNVSPHSS